MTYAIIKTGGRQYRVAEGDTVDVDLLDVDAGKTATFGEVLMFADGKNVTHGDPLISGAKVTARLSSSGRTKKSSRSNTNGAKVITARLDIAAN